MTDQSSNRVLVLGRLPEVLQGVMHGEGPLKLSRFAHSAEKRMAARSIRNVLTTTLAIGLLGLTAQGGAAIEAWNEEAVTFADLNMSSQAGVTTLYKRLEIAARRVCSDRKNQWIENLVDRNRYPACVAEAMDNAVISVDQPGLTAEHLAHTRTRTRAAPAVR